MEWLLLKFYLELQKMKLRFSASLDADEDLRSVKKALQETRREEQEVKTAIERRQAESEQEATRFNKDHEQRCGVLEAEYEAANARYSLLKQEVSLLEPIWQLVKEGAQSSRSRVPGTATSIRWAQSLPKGSLVQILPQREPDLTKVEFVQDGEHYWAHLWRFTDCCGRAD